MSDPVPPGPERAVHATIDSLSGRIALMVVGLGVLTCGVIAAFRDLDRVSVAALLATGFAILFIGFYAGYISSFKFGQLEAVIAGGVQMIKTETDRAVTQVQDTAQSASATLKQAASEFQFLRSGMVPGGTRDDSESKVLEGVMLSALAQPPSVEDIKVLARSPELNDRVSALGALRVNPTLWDFESVLFAIENARGGFDLDRYMGLASDMIHRMTPEERDRLRLAVEKLRSKRKIRPEQIRWLTAERLLRLMSR